MSHWIVLLLGRRNPWDGDGALKVVEAETAEEAVRLAHPRPPSSLQVRHAWTVRLAEPYAPTLIPAEVEAPEWGKPRTAR